jgi:hypothetical protein
MTYYLALSDAPRWGPCPSSVGQERAKGGVQSPAAAEGTAAHWVLEQVLEGKNPTGETAPNGYLTDETMFHHAQRAAGYIAPLVDYHRVERNITLITPNGGRIFGRYDLGGYNSATKTVHLFQYKYGFELVEPAGNLQLIGEAAGFMQEENHVVENVELHVIQPRGNHPVSWVRSDLMTMSEYQEALQDLYAKADRALAGSEVTTPGGWCKYCAKKTECHALRRAGLSVIDRMETFETYELTPEGLDFELNLVEQNLKVLKQHQDALEKQVEYLLQQGKYVPNRMIVEQYGREFWKDVSAAISVAAAIGVDIKKEEAITPKQAISAGLPEDIVRTLTTTPFTGHKVVKKDACKEARKAFKNVKI